MEKLISDTQDDFKLYLQKTLDDYRKFLTVNFYVLIDSWLSKLMARKSEDDVMKLEAEIIKYQNDTVNHFESREEFNSYLEKILKMYAETK